jgi:hypothetical protein
MRLAVVADSLVVVVWAMFLPMSVMVTVAPETPPPEESRTVPLMLPYTACALAAGAIATDNRSARQASVRRVVKILLHLALEKYLWIPGELFWSLRFEEQLGIGKNAQSVQMGAPGVSIRSAKLRGQAERHR